MQCYWAQGEQGEVMNLSVLSRAFIACFLWSTAFVAIKIGLPYTTPLNFAGVRFMLAGLFVLGVMGSYRSSYKSILLNWRVVLKVALLQTFVLYFLFYIGMSRISGALGAIITGASPLWGMLIAHFFMTNDKLTPQKTGAFLFGFSGIILVAFGKNSSSGSIDLVGLGAMLGASLASGFAALLVAKDKQKIPAVALNGAQLLVGGLLLVGVSLVTEDVVLPTSPAYYGSLLYLALLSAIAFSLWFSLIKEGVPLSSLNLWKFIIPVSGALLSWVILPAESPTIWALLGMVLVGSGIVVYYMPVE